MAPAILLMAAGPSTTASHMNDAPAAARFERLQQALQSHSYPIVLFGDSITRELETAGPQP
jgi:hypothetical protein